ncbi:DUF1559 domain-containing protein [Tundrisphaera sp. TA3]|uniref:DUF1559 family PulG-like putative transporter n=1 Tax=Tundrisphaera sp. TA3 TaxID=3435775 RepID=UPI003EC0352A
MNQPASQPVPWKCEDYLGHPDPRARAANNLKFIALALHNFAKANGGQLPAPAIRKDGRPLLSWRVAILPFVEQHSLYRKFHLDEAWDSPHNRPLLEEMPRVYASATRTDGIPHATHYQAIVGPGALFDGEDGPEILGRVRVANPTFLVVEAADPVPWAKPEDLPYDEGKPLPKFGGSFEDGFYAAYTDGWPRFVGRNVAPETILALIGRGNG